MVTRAKSLPYYALDCVEQTVYHLKMIDDIARQIQEAAIEGGHFEFAKVANDIRTRSIDARGLLHQTRTGDYEI